MTGKEIPMGRSGHKMVHVGGNLVYIFGGIDNQGNYSNELWAFDATQNPVEMKWIKATVNRFLIHFISFHSLLSNFDPLYSFHTHAHTKHTLNTRSLFVE
jgi:hypothetical protein